MKSQKQMVFPGIVNKKRNIQEEPWGAFKGYRERRPQTEIKKEDRGRERSAGSGAAKGCHWVWGAEFQWRGGDRHGKRVGHEDG